MSHRTPRSLVALVTALAGLGVVIPVANEAAHAFAAAPPDVPVEQGFLATDGADAWLAQHPDSAYSPFGILVDYRDGIGEGAIAAVRDSAGVTLARTYPSLGDMELVETSASHLDVALTLLSSDPDVVSARHDTAVHDERTAVQPLAAAVDPAAANQWEHGAFPGMNLGTNHGVASVIVAVIDDGIDLTHPDLIDAIWTNPGEVAGNGIDDDRNGYVDDVHGWDFANNDNNPTSVGGHGVHTAGTIGAVAGNGIGVAGVAAGVTIMPLRFIGDARSGLTSDALAALNYSVAQRVRISSNSWGGSTADASLRSGITAAGAAGQLFVAAAGNSTQNIDITPAYPAAFTMTNLISVASSNSTGGLSTFSNFGVTGVDLAAPGEPIYSTYLNGGYQWMAGTSMATPQVAGAAAVLLSAYPTLTVAQLRTALLTSVHKAAAFTGKVATGGALDVTAALATAATMVNPMPAIVTVPATTTPATTTPADTSTPPSTAPATTAPATTTPATTTPATTAPPTTTPVTRTQRVLSPNTTTRLWNGTTVTLRWQGTGSGTVTVRVVNTLTGVASTIGTGKPVTGSLAWKVNVAPGRYLVQVSNGAVIDRSDAAAFIYSHIPGATAPGAPSVSVASATGGTAHIVTRFSAATGGAAKALVTTTCRRAGSPTKVAYSTSGNVTFTGLMPHTTYSCSSTVTNAAGLTSAASVARSIVIA